MKTVEVFCLTLLLYEFGIGVINASNKTCYANYSCPNDGFCDPNTNICAANDPTILCGGYGAFLQCGLQGIVIGECGSGKNLDCSNQGGCGSNICEGIECSYPALIPSFMSTTQWICGTYGTKLSCKDYNGSVLVGVCGAGKKEDCTKYCDGYHGILCAKQEYFNVNWNDCTWITGDWGQWVYCEEGIDLATGHCGSGEHKDCPNDTVHQLQCCSMIYNTSTFR